MDGLEAVEIKHRKVALDNRDLRLDTEYFQKSYLKSEEVLHLKGFQRIKDLDSTVRSFGG